jgi:putative transposase
VKFDFIAAESAHKRFDVKFMCGELEVSKSGFYASRSRGISQRKREDLALVPLVHAEFRKHPRGCGSRMVLGGLRGQGHATSRKRVVRLMSEENLRHRLKRRFVRTTQSRHDKPVAKNVLERSFNVGEPNKVWASDITYVHTKRGWSYLAAVLDLGSRKGRRLGRRADDGGTASASRPRARSSRPERRIRPSTDRSGSPFCLAFLASWRLKIRRA